MPPVPRARGGWPATFAGHVAMLAGLALPVGDALKRCSRRIAHHTGSRHAREVCKVFERRPPCYRRAAALFARLCALCRPPLFRAASKCCLPRIVMPQALSIPSPVSAFYPALAGRGVVSRYVLAPPLPRHESARHSCPGAIIVPCPRHAGEELPGRGLSLRHLLIKVACTVPLVFCEGCNLPVRGLPRR